jgi:hypothetical protein
MKSKRRRAQDSTIGNFAAMPAFGLRIAMIHRLLKNSLLA